MVFNVFVFSRVIVRLPAEVVEEAVAAVRYVLKFLLHTYDRYITYSSFLVL